MTAKQWSFFAAKLLLILLAACVALVFCVDPFEIYHRAWFYQPAYSSDAQMYANAGVARSYDYDSVIIGSSVTENCLPSVYARALGGSFVKLCMNAGQARDHAKMLSLAFSQRDIRRVVYGLDLFAYSLGPAVQKAVTPDYLYDDLLLNDVFYWLNKSVLLRYVPEAFLRAGTEPDDSARDSMYFWNPPFMPTWEELLAGVHLDAAPAQPQSADSLSDVTLENFEQNLLPFLREHPETSFIVFFPPYSLLYWVQQAREGMLSVRLAQRAQLAQLLLAEPNVELYDFQATAEWTQNYSLYFDSIHYISSVNNAMASAFAAQTGRVFEMSTVLLNNSAIERDAQALLDAYASGKESP